MSELKERKRDYPCLKCNVHVKKNEWAIRCKMCELWVHRKCSQIKDELWDHLVEQEENEGSLYWSCPACKSFSSKFHNSLSKIDKRLTVVEETTKAHEEKITDVESKLGDISTSLEAVKTSVTQAQMSGAGSSATSTRAVMREINDRKANQSIAIIHGLPEPDFATKESKDRMAADINKLKEMIAELNIAADQLQTSKIDN